VFRGRYSGRGEISGSVVLNLNLYLAFAKTASLLLRCAPVHADGGWKGKASPDIVGGHDEHDDMAFSNLKVCIH
jgi:hypothetical protein